MKRLFIISVILLGTLQTNAQVNREKIKAMKTAFITNALDLSSKEAQQFWPIYNAYDKRIYQAKTIRTRAITRKVRLAGGVQQLSHSDANDILQEFIDTDYEVAKAKQDLKDQLSTVVSAKKIILLFRAEQDFNKKLLRDFREQRQKNLQKRIRN